MGEIEDPLERTRTLICAQVESMLRSKDEHATMLTEMYSLSKDRLSSIAALREGYVDLVRSVLRDAQKAGALRDDIDVRYLTLALLGLLNRVLVWYRRRGPLSPGQLGQLLAVIFLAGVAPSATSPALLLDVPLQALGSDFGAIDHALGIRRDAFGSAGRRPILIGLGIRNEGLHRAVFGASDADPAFPAGMTSHVRFGVGDVQDVVLVDIEAAGTAELRPLVEKLPILVENLDAVVGAVADKQTSFGIEGQRVGRIEVTRRSSFFPPRLDELAVFRELNDARVGVPAVPIGDEDIAVGGDDHVRGLIERVRPISGDASLPQRHQDLSIRVKFEDLLALAVLPLSVGHPNVSLLIDVNTVRKHEHAAAKALEQFTGRIELQNRWKIGSRARIGSAAFGHPHATVAIDSTALVEPPFCHREA